MQKARFGSINCILSAYVYMCGACVCMYVCVSSCVLSVTILVLASDSWRTSVEDVLSMHLPFQVPLFCAFISVLSCVFSETAIFTVSFSRSVVQRGAREASFWRPL